MIFQIDRIKEKERFQDKFGIPYDIRSNEYTNVWLKGLYPNLPVPDIRHWWRDPGLYLPLSCLFTFIASTKGGNNGTIITSAINTTGANLIVGIHSVYAVTPSTIITDSKLNTYTPLTAYGTPVGAFVRIEYAQNPTVGTGHVFSCTGVGTQNAIIVMAFSGAVLSSVFDVENGATGSGPSIQTGNISPSNNNELLVASISEFSVTPLAINSGFTVAEEVVNNPGVNLGTAGAYLIQTTSALANPTWSSSGGNFGSAAASIASFISAATATGWGPLLGLQRNRIINVLR